MGKPDKSSLSAGNRRYVDAITGKAFGGVGGNSLSGMAIQGGLGGLARMGSESFLGRAAGMAGMALGGPMGGALGLAISGIASLAGSAFTGIWSTLGKVVTAPFQAVGSAASFVTGTFYKLALAAAPLVLGFGFINKRVQETSQQHIALNTVSKSLGSSGQAESKWLMNMANRDGMRYDTLIQPYTSFIASASPAMGLPMAKDVFESFTQFGLTRGAGDVSMGLAMKAVSQMAGKGKIQAEELRGQLGDAPGFGEMQGIFAQAYQRSLGRSGGQIKEGQKGIEELNEAMKKGNVLSAKVLPFVAEIAKQMAAGGLDEARMASFAEQNRFRNQLSQGWKNFGEGGGERGLAYFWRMMQEMGTWWIDNGATMGRYFEAVMIGLDAFRLSIKELWHFGTTGEATSITEWLKSQGFDVDTIRSDVIAAVTSIKEIFRQVMQIMGFEKNGSIMEGMKDKITNFTKNLREVLAEVTYMLQSINTFLTAARNWGSMTKEEQVMALIPGTSANKTFSTMVNSGFSAAGSLVSSTYKAGTTSYEALLGNSPSPVVPYTASEREKYISQIPTAWNTTPQAAVPTSTTQTSNYKVDVSVKLDGNADVMSLIDKPVFYSKIAEVAGGALDRKISGALIGAPQQ